MGVFAYLHQNTNIYYTICALSFQGNPIKIDGLGIFWTTVESTKEGITKEVTPLDDWIHEQLAAQG